MNCILHIQRKLLVNLALILMFYPFQDNFFSKPYARSYLRPVQMAVALNKKYRVFLLLPLHEKSIDF